MDQGMNRETPNKEIGNHKNLLAPAMENTGPLVFEALPEAST